MYNIIGMIIYWLPIYIHLSSMLVVENKMVCKKVQHYFARHDITYDL